MVEMKVQGLTTDPKTNQQIVWLQSLEEEIVIPIVIGDTEALSIYTELAEEPPPRPLTHDLIRSILDHFEARVKELQIVDLKGGTFYSRLWIVSRGEEVDLDSRPSDGIALALKYGAPISMSREVLLRAGYAVKGKGPGGILQVEPLGGPEKALPPEGEEEAPEPSAETAGAPDDPLHALKQRMQEAVRDECYEEAGRIQKEIERIEREREKR